MNMDQTISLSKIAKKLTKLNDNMSILIELLRERLPITQESSSERSSAMNKAQPNPADIPLAEFEKTTKV